MSLVVNTNVSSLIAQQNLSTSESSLQTAMQRLSSGLRINSAADDAAGYAIANGMTSQINGMQQAENNANDGVSMVQTTSGALQQIDNNLQTIRQLTVEAANGTNSQTQDSYIQTEINQDLAEIDRVSQQTNFNGVSVLGQNATVNIQVGANDGQTIGVDLQQIDQSTLGLTGFNVVPPDPAATVSNLATAQAGVGAGTFVVTPSSGTAATYTLESDGTYTESGAAAATGISAATVLSDIATAEGVAGNTITATVGTTSYAISSAGAITSGGSAVFYDASAATAGATLTTAAQPAATADPLATLDAAINQVSQLAANLGATQNRLTSAISDIETANTNLQSSRSAIQDADYAQEVSAMTQAQILQQAGTSVLSHANQTPQSVLTLLQNA